MNVSLNAETLKGLKKIQESGQARSKVIENALGPLIRELDPRESCEAVSKIDCLLQCEISSAVSKRDFEKVTSLTAIGNALGPSRSLCRPVKGNSADKAKTGKKTCSFNTLLFQTKK
ncbi:MAG: hypothetical protein ABSB71_12765 [Candidatus Bathyarchaeia archaeon]|jgi:hypothetical protein